MSDKKRLGLVVVGHVDAGKSTTTGHLMFELGGINERDMEKLRKEAEAQGKGSFSFAFFMDKTKNERERGVTISCTTKEFFTENYYYTIIDAPGHRDFIKNMISGASQADVALLMVPANRGGFEMSIQKGNHKKGEVQGQTRQHARLLHLLGVEQIIVGINKMDDESVGYKKERFEEIKSEVSKMLANIGFKTKKIPFIPMSGWKGDNLTTKSANMDWYKGFKVKPKKNSKEVEGCTLLDALNDVVICPKRPKKKPFRMPVSGVYKIEGADVITGRIEQGTLKPDMEVQFAPTIVEGKMFTIDRIEIHHKEVNLAEPGDNVGVSVKGLPKNNMPKAGDVMFIKNEKGDNDPPAAASTFRAAVFVQDHPGKLRCTKDKKSVLSIHVRTAKAPCQILKILWKRGRSTNNEKTLNPTYIEAGDEAEVIFKPQKPICVDAYDVCKPLGRMAGMNNNSLIMLGRVLKINENYDDI